ncbi:MAG: thymidine kinase, partial [Actinobacteria bacterium]|nr:thymidine kinase [Actinomycetota bacterium]
AGVMITEGEQVVVGDVSPENEIAYEVLCRRHHMRNVTARASKLIDPSLNTKE